MAGLIGKYSVSLDPKGRLAIPSRHRSAFPESQQDKIVVTRGLHNCVTGYYQERWDELIENIESADRTYAEKLAMRRAFVGSSVETAFDKQGRITLPSHLIEFAGMQDCSEVIVMGCTNYLEIWNPKVFEEYEEQNEQLLHKVLNEINM